MALDVTGIIIIILFFIRGYTRGIILALFSLAAILLGIIISLKFSQSLSTWMLAKGWIANGWALLISYIILFTFVVIIVRLLAKLIQKAFEAIMLGFVNRIAGGLVFALLGAILWSTFLWIGAHMHLLSAEMIASSKTYSTLSLLAPKVFEIIGALLPFAKHIFDNMQHFFDTINQNIPADVGAH